MAGIFDQFKKTVKKRQEVIDKIPQESATKKKEEKKDDTKKKKKKKPSNKDVMDFLDTGEI